MDLVGKLLSIAACVAVAATISACSGGAEGTPSSSSAVNVPAPTSVSIPSDYDEWENWHSGESDPNMTAVGGLLGLKGVEYPQADFVQQGYVGVAQLEAKCIVIFSSIGAQKEGELAAGVLSRYDLSINETIPARSVHDLKVAIDSKRALCN